MTPEQIAELIRGLTAIELLELNRILGDDPGFEPIGVREPAWPTPPGLGAEVEVHGVDLDYAESAE